MEKIAGEKCYVNLPSPPITPESTVDEEKFLVPYHFRPKIKETWCDLRNIPVAILSVSIFQIVFHALSTPHLERLLRFEPSKQFEIWRSTTYMLVHDDWYHLILNVFIQCIFAILLEKRQGHFRVLLIYALGGITGVLGASCIHPNLVIGASAGVYALLISNVADIVLNYNNVKYKLYRVSSIGVLVLFDIIYNFVHAFAKKEPVISWEAHFVGGLSGLLLGFVVYRSKEDFDKISKINRALFWTDLMLYILVMSFFVILTIQIRKCTPVNVINFRYVYFC